MSAAKNISGHAISNLELDALEAVCGGQDAGWGDGDGDINDAGTTAIQRENGLTDDIGDW